MPYRDKNQTVNAPWATPLETFSVESTKRCSFACYVFIFWPLKCQLCFHERKCGDTLRHFKAAQLFLKSLVTSCVLISIENRKRERNETSACVGCKCKSVLFTEKKRMPQNGGKRWEVTWDNIVTALFSHMKHLWGTLGRAPWPVCLQGTSADGLTDSICL